MNTQTRMTNINMPVRLYRVAESLKKLSKNELEILELFLDKEARQVIKGSVSQAKRGKMRELKS